MNLKSFEIVNTNKPSSGRLGRGGDNSALTPTRTSVLASRRWAEPLACVTWKSRKISREVNSTFKIKYSLNEHKNAFNMGSFKRGSVQVSSIDTWGRGPDIGQKKNDI